MSTVVKDLGAVSAYAYAVEKGYTGTEAEFAELMADYAEVGQRAEDAANSALESKTAAQTAATTATNKASEAATSAQTATTKAGEATTAAGTATTAKNDAVAAKTAAETAQGKAEDAQAAAESVAESIPSDYSQLSEDVSDLMEGLSSIECAFTTSKNLFNPNDPDIEENVELLSNGATQAKTNFFASGFIPIRAGKTICCHYPTGTYGSSSKIVWYNSNKERTGYSNLSAENRLTDANGHTYIRYTFSDAPSSVYIRLTGYMPNESFYMYVYADEMPSEYEPYSEEIMLAPDVGVDFANIKNVSVSKNDTDFIKANPKNLNDLSAMVVGAIKNSSSNADLDTSVTSWMSTDFIPVEVGKTYILYVYGGIYYGVNYKGIPYYDANKAYVGHIIPTGGVQTTGVIDTITIPNGCAYIRTMYSKNHVENPKRWINLQIFEGSTYPSAYLPYDSTTRLQGAGLMPEYATQYNRLFGKTAIWNGDSICAADNDAQGGWAYRIGAENGMYVRNYAVSGGTIAVSSASHKVVNTIDTMIADFPNADYVIIEGGTNDADILGDNGIGTFSTNDFSAEYISNLDTSTFSGALEQIFYKLVTTYKTKHIGYVIPQKMGHTAVLVARRRTYFDRAIDICKKWGVPYIDLWNDLWLNWELSAHWDQSMTSAQNEEAGNLYQDGQHLTTHGYAVESPVIAEWLKHI